MSFPFPDVSSTPLASLTDLTGRTALITGGAQAVSYTHLTLPTIYSV